MEALRASAADGRITVIQGCWRVPRGLPHWVGNFGGLLVMPPPAWPFDSGPLVDAALWGVSGAGWRLRLGLGPGGEPGK